jgi:formylglycine-generating enzyme
MSVEGTDPSRRGGGVRSVPPVLLAKPANWHGLHGLFLVLVGVATSCASQGNNLPPPCWVDNPLCYCSKHEHCASASGADREEAVMAARKELCNQILVLVQARVERTIREHNGVVVENTRSSQGMEECAQGLHGSRPTNYWKDPVSAEEYAYVRVASGNLMDAAEQTPVNLRRGLDPMKGWLFVTVEGPDHGVVDAEVLLNGRVVGSQPWKGKLPTGEVTLSARTKDGRVSEEKRVMVVLSEPTSAVLGVPEREEHGSIVWIPLPDAPGGPIEIMRSEVTVGMYRACVADNGRSGKGCSDHHLTGYEWPGQTFTKHDECNWTNEQDLADHPLNCVVWQQAREFCAWAGGRLPTEGEWEHAATSGGKARYQYPWGRMPHPSCERAVMKEHGERRGCGKNMTWPVCHSSKRSGRSDQDVCDLAGNVWEWTSSCHGSGCDRRKGIKQVQRGGSWVSKPKSLRVASRRLNSPEFRLRHVGFRCVRSRSGTGGAQ